MCVQRKFKSACAAAQSDQNLPWAPRMQKKVNSKRKFQGVPQSQAAAFPRHQEEEETDKTKQAQIEETYEKH